jgi:hypothetical protein
LKNSIGLWIDNELQKKILCFEKNDTNNSNLKSIYQNLYTDPQKALNQTRINLEKSIKNFLKNKLKLSEDKFFITKHGKDSALDLNGLINLLKNSPKKEQQFDIKLLGNNCIELINQLDEKYSNTNKEIVTAIINDCCDKSHQVRRFGNAGSHSNEIKKNELREKAFMAFLSFFHIYNILFDENKNCKYFNNFISKLEVIYETKDDVEEWKKIKFNKLKFNYNLYKVEGKIKNKKQLILDDIIIHQKNTTSSSNNIYFVYFNEGEDETEFKRFKKFYKNLSYDVDEKKYFLINKNEDIEYETIDGIPLRLLPKNENHPYKWDMCYINLSIEFDDFGVDLILFLNFNQEKFNSTIENYDLTLMSLDSEAQEQS